MAAPSYMNFTAETDPRAISIHGEENGSRSAMIDEGRILSKYNQAMFEILIPSFIMVLIVMVVGCVGNAVTVYIYLKKMRRTTSRIFILGLAFCDLINCVFTMPIEIAIIINFYTFDYPVTCAVGRTLTYVFNGASALLLCGIAVDRFRKICRPLKPVFTPKKTKLICLICLALAFAIYIPGYEVYGTYTIEMKLPSNVTIIGKTCLVRDKYSKTEKNAKITRLIFGAWFLGTISVLVTMVVFYIIIGKAIYSRMKLEEKRHNSVSASKRQQAETRKVFADPSSETSCSFNDHLETNRHVLTNVPDPVKMTIRQSLLNRFSIFRPNTVNTLKRQRMSRRIRAGRTTVMLFAVTIAYVISFLPFVTIVIIRMVDRNYYTSLNGTLKSVWNVFLRSYVINCSVNPILYGFLNNDFRKKTAELVEDICCCFKVTFKDGNKPKYPQNVVD